MDGNATIPTMEQSCLLHLPFTKHNIIFCAVLVRIISASIFAVETKYLPNHRTRIIWYLSRRLFSNEESEMCRTYKMSSSIDHSIITVVLYYIEYTIIFKPVDDEHGSRQGRQR
jgi:hypothetical protein